MMTLSELRTLVALGESSTLEFKKTTPEKERACRTLCAFGGVAVYDDRLEIWSAGQLHFGLTPDILFGPHESKPWNPMIASVFYRRGIIETWGRGIQKITRLLREAGQEIPELSSVASSVLLIFPLPKLSQDDSTGLEVDSTGLEGLLGKLKQEYPQGLPGKLRKLDMEVLIDLLCSDGFVRPNDLARVLDRSAAFLRETYLKPMIVDGRLILRYPDRLNHPEQAYCSRKMDG